MFSGLEAGSTFLRPEWLIGSTPSTVLIDTGSQDILLPRSNCTTCGRDQHLFSPFKSKTFSSFPGDRFDIRFGTGGDTVPLSKAEGATCDVVTDSVSIGGLSVPQQQFLLCDMYGNALASQPIDGILGIGASDSFFNTSGHFLWELYNSGQLPSPEFGVYEIPGARSGSEITLGAHIRASTRARSRRLL